MLSKPRETFYSMKAGTHEQCPEHLYVYSAVYCTFIQYTHSDIIHNGYLHTSACFHFALSQVVTLVRLWGGPCADGASGRSARRCAPLVRAAARTEASGLINDINRSGGARPARHRAHEAPGARALGKYLLTRAWHLAARTPGDPGRPIQATGDVIRKPLWCSIACVSARHLTLPKPYRLPRWKTSNFIDRRPEVDHIVRKATGCEKARSEALRKGRIGPSSKDGKPVNQSDGAQRSRL